MAAIIILAVGSLGLSLPGYAAPVSDWHAGWIVGWQGGWEFWTNNVRPWACIYSKPNGSISDDVAFHGTKQLAERDCNGLAKNSGGTFIRIESYFWRCIIRMPDGLTADSVIRSGSKVTGESECRDFAKLLDGTLIRVDPFPPLD
jgi:hypothetical protein